MKNTRRFIAGLSALAMAAAMAMSASAAEANQINQDSDPKQGDSEVTYNVEAAYTVTIPTGADISGGSDEQSITANDVLLEQGQKITVTLSGASNTASGKSFTAKDESGESTVKYTIKAGDTDVAVGDKVAEFETKTGEQSATLTFTKDADSTPTFAGTHTETLTFGIAVEGADPLTKVTSSDEIEALGNSNGMKKIALNDAKQLAAAKTDETGKTCAVIYDYEPNGNIYKLYYVTNSGNDDWWMDTNIFEMYGCDELYYVNP